MKTVFVWIAFATLICLAGCYRKEPIPRPWAPGIPDCPGQVALDSWIGSVQIVMITDTLRFLPGDMACAQGFVVVKDDAQRIIRGVRVCLELLDSIGWIGFENDSNITDSIGRVYFHFCVLNQVGPGYNIIHAWVGSREDRWTIWLQAANGGFVPIRMNLSKRQVYATPPAEDSLVVAVIVSDASHLGIPGIVVPVVTSGGYLAPVPPTDSTGCARTKWFTHGVAPGWYSFWASYGGCSAADSVLVLPGIRPEGARL